MIKKFIDFLSEKNEIEFPKSVLIEKFLTNLRLNAKLLKITILNLIQLTENSFDIDLDTEKGKISIHFNYEKGLANIDIYDTKTKESEISFNNKMSFEKAIKIVADYFEDVDLLN